MILLYYNVCCVVIYLLSQYIKRICFISFVFNHIRQILCCCCFSCCFVSFDFICLLINCDTRNSYIIWRSQQMVDLSYSTNFDCRHNPNQITVLNLIRCQHNVEKKHNITAITVFQDPAHINSVIVWFLFVHCIWHMWYDIVMWHFNWRYILKSA